MPPVSARVNPMDMARSPSSPVKSRRSAGSSAYWQAQAKIHAVSAFRTSPAASHAVLLRTRCLFSVISLCPFYLESVGKNIPLWAVSVNRIKKIIRKHRFNLWKFADCAPLLPFTHIHFSSTESSCRFKVAQFPFKKYRAKAFLSGFPAETGLQKHFETVAAPESASADSSCSPMGGNPSAKEGTAAIFLQQPLLAPYLSFSSNPRSSASTVRLRSVQATRTKCIPGLPPRHRRHLLGNGRSC